MIPPFIKWLIGHIMPPDSLLIMEDCDEGFSTQKVESGDVVEDSITVNGHTFLVRGFRWQQLERCEAFVDYVKDDRLKFGYLDCARVLSVVRSDSKRNEGCHESDTQNLDCDHGPFRRSRTTGGHGGDSGGDPASC